MNFSIHLDDPLAHALNDMARQSGKTRNALIREAIRAFVGHFTRSKWPKTIKALAGADPTLEPFEDLRRELSPLTKDPFV